MRARSKTRSRSPAWRFTLAGGVPVAIATLFFTIEAAWPALLAYLASINVAAFLLYAHDKRAARRRRLRVPEATLHLFALAGGSPAALLAQSLFRHKTQKRSFQVVFWLLVVAQAGLIGWLLHEHWG